MTLLTHHEELIRASAIAPEIAAARGYRSITVKAELDKLGFSKRAQVVPGMLIPIRDTTGQIATYQYRPDEPPIDKKGKASKYLFPVNSRMVLDIPPAVRDQLGDPTVPLWITEGSRKNDAAVSAGMCCISLAGVWSFRGRNDKGGITALPDWEYIALNDRAVFICFDSDVMEKREVRQALDRVAAFIKQRGGQVRYVILPPGENGQKTGLDDFLAGGKGVDDLMLLIRSSLPPLEPMVEEGTLILDPQDPMPTAEAFVAMHHQHGGTRTLHHHRNEFFAWTGTHYQEQDHAGIRAKLYTWLKRAKRITEEGAPPVDFKPTRNKVADVIEALRAVAYLGSEIEPPALLDPNVQIPPENLVSCQNGLLHLPVGKLYSHTPAFFSTFSLPFDYDPDAPEPVEWLKFLRSLWPQVEVNGELQDRPEIESLQQIFGLMLTANTNHQKVFMFIGPRRCGKGTIARVLTALLGSRNCAGPTLTSLGQPFGMQKLIGKHCAIISDLRLGPKSDLAAIAEKLLSISGQDLMDVDRKFKETWTGYLPTRFLLLTNELPRIADASGALPGRFIILTFTESFYGREDMDLGRRLAAELPSILAWAVDGWTRLEETGHFIQPPASRKAMRQLENLASPVAAFIRDRCAVKWPDNAVKDEAGSLPPVEVETTALWFAWKQWCNGQEINPGTQPIFGRNLSAAFPQFQTTQHLNDRGERPRFYVGLRLLGPGEMPDEQEGDSA